MMNSIQTIESAFEDYLANKSSIHNKQANDKSRILQEKMLQELNKTNNTAQSKANLEEILRCFICFGRVKNAQMCPSCSKLCCNTCIRKWLMEQKSQCPHCRSSLKVTQLVNCRFVSELFSAIDHLGGKREEDTELCPLHHAKLSYYCKTCQVPICADCAVFGTDHKNHEFDHIAKVYEHHVEQVKNEALGLKKRMKELSTQLELVESTIETVTKTKEEKSNEVAILVEQLNQKLESELKAKLLTLLAQKSSMSDEIEFLQSMQNELNRQLTQSPKSVLISKSSELIKMLREINAKPLNKYNKSSVSLEFSSELVPTFDSGIFYLKPFSILRQNSEVVYSEPLNSNGLTWRLKVYPNGNGVAKGSYISVFLEMIKGLQDSSKYEYKVEMINQRNSQIVVLREFASEFETGECWGYNRFFSLDLLEREGYLIPEKDTIVLKYYVRAPTYYQQCIDQKHYIQHLENLKNQSESLIAELKEKLNVENFRFKKLQELHENHSFHNTSKLSNTQREQREDKDINVKEEKTEKTEKKTNKNEVNNIMDKDNIIIEGIFSANNSTTRTMEKIKNIDIEHMNKNDNPNNHNTNQIEEEEEEIKIQDLNKNLDLKALITHNSAYAIDYVDEYEEQYKLHDDEDNYYNHNHNNKDRDGDGDEDEENNIINNNNNNNINNDNNNNDDDEEDEDCDGDDDDSELNHELNIKSRKRSLGEMEILNGKSKYEDDKLEEQQSLDELCDKISNNFITENINPINLDTLFKKDENDFDKSSEYSHVKNLLPNFEEEHLQMKSRKNSDKAAFTASVLQFSESLLKKLENIKNINQQNRVNNDKKIIPQIQQEYHKKIDFYEKENQFQHLFD